VTVVCERHHQVIGHRVPMSLNYCGDVSAVLMKTSFMMHVQGDTSEIKTEICRLCILIVEFQKPGGLTGFIEPFVSHY